MMWLYDTAMDEVERFVRGVNPGDSAVGDVRTREGVGSLLFTTLRSENGRGRCFSHMFLGCSVLPENASFSFMVQS